MAKNIFMAVKILPNKWIVWESFNCKLKSTIRINNFLNEYDPLLKNTFAPTSPITIHRKIYRFL